MTLYLLWFVAALIYCDDVTMVDGFHFFLPETLRANQKRGFCQDLWATIVYAWVHTRAITSEVHAYVLRSMETLTISAIYKAMNYDYENK